MSAPLTEHARCTAAAGRIVTRHDDGSVSLTKSITADEPYLSGHYPGNPLYPGVFDIDLALVLLAEIAGGETRPTDIEKVRFMHPLRPGDTVVVTATELDAEPSSRRFRLIGLDQQDQKVFVMTVKVVP